MKRGTKGAWSADFDCVERYIGGNVGKMRRDFGLTQEQLAERVGIQIKSLQNIERGRANVTARVLAALADVFLCSPGDLFCHAEIEPPKRGRPPKVHVCGVICADCRTITEEK